MIIIFCHPINQLLPITYDIFHSFDEGMENGVKFLDISKAFDKIWHKGLIFKLRQYSFTGNSLTLLTDFLSNRKQRVVFNGRHSSWADIKVGVPQGSILGLLLFFVYIDDLMGILNSNSRLFADDTSWVKLIIGLKSGKWVLILTEQNLPMKVCSVEKNYIYFPPITFNNIPVKRVLSHKYLGLTLNLKLNFHEYISSILLKVSKLTAVLQKLQIVLPRNSLLTI